MARNPRRSPYRSAYGGPAGSVPPPFRGARPGAHLAHAERARRTAETVAQRAFEQGRRQRERAERRHRRLARRSMPRASVGRHIALGIVLMPVAGFMVLAAGATLAVMGVIAMTVLFQIAPFILLIALVVTMHGHRRRLRNAARRPLSAHPPQPGYFPPSPPRVDPARAWEQSRHRFGVLKSAYAAHECDPMAVLRLPALSDVSVPSTARFVDAFAEASALESDEFPGPEHAQRFARAVELAERSWHAARAAAERIRLSGLGPAERSTVERVVKLLTTARDSDNEAERLSAYAKARSELAKLDAAGVVHVPQLAKDHLEEAARGELPG